MHCAPHWHSQPPRAYYLLQGVGAASSTLDWLAKGSPMPGWKCTGCRLALKAVKEFLQQQHGYGMLSARFGGRRHTVTTGAPGRCR